LRTPERGWKRSLTLRACVKEGPGGSGRTVRVTACIKWYQSRKSLLSVAERRNHHATEKRKTITQSREGKGIVWGKRNVQRKK
jgi:hypothetical protein